MDNNKKSDGFATKAGFIFAAAGSAVGLGNLWKFPYLLGSNGGGAFLIVYVIICAIVAVPCCMLESAIGKHTRITSGTRAYAVIAQEKGKTKAWGIVGFLGVLSCFAMLFYYGVVGGWVLDYLFKSIFIGLPSADSAESVFSASTSSLSEPIIWMLVFLVITVIICLGGIKKGIEKISNIMMPTLFVMLIILVIRSVTLPGSSEGIVWMFKPNFKAINGSVVIAALSQVFFSCSLGIGILITYGGYATKDQNLIKSSILVPVLDTLVAVLAGLIPSVFACGYNPSAGPGLLFITLPSVISSFGPVIGRIFGVLFFLLASFAALTTSVAMVELPVNWIMDQFKLSRKKSVFIDFVITAVFGVLCSLAESGLLDFTLIGKNIFDFFDFISATIMMPLGGLFGAIFVGYIWKPESVIPEVTNNGQLKFGWFPWFKLCVKILIPILIVIIFLNGFGIIG
ncbi:MAG: sodium-dependent transporter [Clostridia bacterium]|jgi:NSS family neurotransmitter:Na+ symporter|nr:sodium-dependent transporter [Clostridia bacterium]